MITTRSTDCPPWCQAHEDAGPDYGPGLVHSTTLYADDEIGDNEITVSAWPGPAVEVTVELTTSGHWAPAELRRAACALARAAELLEGQPTT